MTDVPVSQGWHWREGTSARLEREDEETTGHDPVPIAGRHWKTMSNRLSAVQEIPNTHLPFGRDFVRRQSFRRLIEATISASGHLSRKMAVLFPGPQPRSIMRIGEVTLIRAARSDAGCVRTTEKRK
jgi:hypothetical protein